MQQQQQQQHDPEHAHVCDAIKQIVQGCNQQGLPVIAEIETSTATAA
jgi:hypothetical protein